MTATFSFDESNDAGEVITVGITNLNFGSVDDPNLVPVTYPIVAGTNSFDKYVKGAFSGSFTRLENFKFWKASGSYETGEGITFDGDSVVYVQPAQTATGDPAIDTSEPASQNVSIGNSLTGYIEGPPAGYYKKTDYIRLQLQTTIATPGGPTNTKTLVLQYDEQ